MRRGYKLAVVLAILGFGMIIVPFVVSTITYVPCNYCADRNYGSGANELLGIVGIFLLGVGTLAALNGWKPRVTTR